MYTFTNVEIQNMHTVNYIMYKCKRLKMYKVQMYNVQMYNVQMYDVQMYNVQKYNVQKDKCTHLQMVKSKICTRSTI